MKEPRDEVKGEENEPQNDRALIRAALVLAAFGVVLLIYAAFYLRGNFQFTVVEGALTSSAIEKAATSAGEEKGSAPLAEHSIDLNSATAEELTALPGIGPALAQRIVEHRQESGGFLAVEDLLEVEGIGEKTLEELKIYLRVE